MTMRNKQKRFDTIKKYCGWSDYKVVVHFVLFIIKIPLSLVMFILLPIILIIVIHYFFTSCFMY